MEDRLPRPQLRRVCVSIRSINHGKCPRQANAVGSSSVRTTLTISLAASGGASGQGTNPLFSSASFELSTAAVVLGVPGCKPFHRTRPRPNVNTSIAAAASAHLGQRCETRGCIRSNSRRIPSRRKARPRLRSYGLRRLQYLAETALILPPHAASRTRVQMFPQAQTWRQSYPRPLYNFENPLPARKFCHRLRSRGHRPRFQPRRQQRAGPVQSLTAPSQPDIP